MLGQAIDWQLDALVQREGGFTTDLRFSDRLKLRAIVRKVHMKHYPAELVTDLEADRMIEVIAPATAAYLIRQAVDGGKF